MKDHLHHLCLMKDVDTVKDMDQLGYTSVINPMVELAEKDKAKEMK